MSNSQKLWISMVITAVICAALLTRASEEPRADDKVKQPVANEAKIDAEKKDKDAEDPMAIVGVAPTFPLQSNALASIGDNKEDIDDNIDVKAGRLDLDIQPMEDILIALRACSQDYLKQNVDNNINFKAMMQDKTSKQCRGHVVKLTGMLEDFKKIIIPNASGVTNIWGGQTSHSGRIITFRSLEPLPSGIKIGDPVELVGIFMQRYAYLNRSPGEKLTHTPLIFARRLEVDTTLKQVTNENQMSNPIAIILFIFIGLAAVAWCYMRAKDKTIRSNYFTQRKAEKDGPQGLFPKPVLKPKPRQVPPKKN